PNLLKKKEKVKKEFKLPDLPGAVKGKVVTAFPPEPSGYAHLGHAKGFLVNYWLAEEYKGKFHLRFEDTNPALSTDEFYKAQLRDYEWLLGGKKWSKLIYLSDDLPKMYKLAEKLIKSGALYSCWCSKDETSKMRFEGTECKCRKLDPKSSLVDWKKMLAGELGAGAVSIRLKGEMASKNTTMRDPTMFRIAEGNHARHGEKFVVWPSYDFAAPFGDGYYGVTHRIRSKEFELRGEVQRLLQRLMGFKETWIDVQARFNLTDLAVDLPSSKRKLREMINNGELTGWDDVRSSNLVALKKRGFTPEGIQNFMKRLGVTKSEAKVSVKTLEAENRKVIDPISNRRFFVPNPVELTVTGLTKRIVEAPLHPENSKKGFHTIKVDSDIVLVTKADLKS
ncbi:MAG: glutamate--tRNA ligase, partial [Candidatus Diapherotrites archaeon]|nr:glutamate--tRNA ligase [Candidatus Diapherotrites archaeon]